MTNASTCLHNGPRRGRALIGIKRTAAVERTSERHLGPEHDEVVPRDHFGGERPSFERHISRALGDGISDDIASVAYRLVLPPGERPPGRIIRAPGHLAEPGGVAHGKGTKHLGGAGRMSTQHGLRRRVRAGKRYWQRAHRPCNCTSRRSMWKPASRDRCRSTVTRT